MPELPEVEILRRQLYNTIVGKKISSSKISAAKMVLPLTPASFSRKVKGKKITDVMRRAKVLIIRLSDGHFLLIHLKMTGQLIYQPQRGKMVVGGHPQPGGTQGLPNRYTHAIFKFSDGTSLYFNDMRKFGWIKYSSSDEVIGMIARLGIDPLSATFTLPNFGMLLLRKPTRNIKTTLMDQATFGGIGNIYADESLFCARVRPQRKISQMKVSEIRKLHKCIPSILQLSLKQGATSMSDYRHIDGSKGNFKQSLKVYGRSGDKCKVCKSTIKKIKFNQRGTHFCENCQR